MAVCSLIHTKHINTLCGLKAVSWRSHRAVFTVSFNIIKHQNSLSQCVSKALLLDYRFDALPKVNISFKFAKLGLSWVFCVRPVV
jgi:hypothetical protein